ncbi:MAG: beta-lactamase family protein [Bryobacterales bacterium]|nr:beta-lactamase family protein [Bryobacterales bacterium]
MLLPLFTLLLSAAPAEIPALQKEHKVPAVSIAYIENGKLARTEVFGPVKPDTVFQAASISKPVAATAALHMMQHGNFTLDEDVNPKLKSWRVPPPPFSTEHTTLRRLLTHTAGLTVHGFPGYAAGAPLPTLVQILNGEPPANTKPIVPDIPPGSKFRYSGGGYTVMQQLLMDRIGWSFPQIMDRMVLSRIGMKRSTYEQPLPESWAANAAIAHDDDGKPLKGRWHTYPEQAAAGLWTTPTDLALWAIEIREAYHGRSTKIIERSTARLMLTPDQNGRGLGPVIEGTGPTLKFSHGGANAGYRCHFELEVESGNGIVIMTNGDQGGAIIKAVLDSRKR